MSSAYIPDGLLPDRKADPAHYRREYIRLRKIYDPVFREWHRKVKNAATKRWEIRKQMEQEMRE